MGLISIIYVAALIVNLLPHQVESQLCYGSQYDRCSSNNACACFLSVGAASGVGVCAFQLASCSSLVFCDPFNHHCYEPKHTCVYHPQCQSIPICYPMSMMNTRICPPMTVIPNLPADATWEQQGLTVAGGSGVGENNNQLNKPLGLCVDDNDDQTIVIADQFNHRIIQFKRDYTNGQVVAGGNSYGDRLDQLYYPTDVLIDRVSNSFIIADRWNQRVVRWSRRSGTTQGEVLIDDIECWGLAIDEQGNLYVSNLEKREVRRYEIDRRDKNGTVVAGGNGEGDKFNQFDWPGYLFLDRNQSLYVSDYWNHRVMKWDKGATQGVVVAGGQGEGSALTQLYGPTGIFVDTSGTLYVAEEGNHRVTRWTQSSKKKGTVLIGGYEDGSGKNQLSGPTGLSFDKHANLYVVDSGNSRVQRFNIVK